MAFILSIFKSSDNADSSALESADVMIGELNKNYPKMTVENVSIETPDHVFSVLNRDQSTSIFNPVVYMRSQHIYLVIYILVRKIIMIKPSRRFQFSQFFKYIRLQNFLLYGCGQ
jgi:hypothetical protein